MTQVYDLTTQESVAKIARKIDDAIMEARESVSANILHTMFSYYAARMMDDIMENAKKKMEETEKKGESDVP